MRALLLPLLLVLAGCDVLREGSFDRRPGYMERLDGTWTLQVTQRTIATSGAVTETPDPAPRQLTFARSVQCLTQQIDAAGDGDRVLYFDAAPFRPTRPDSGDRCYVVTADETLERFIFVGERSGGLDLVYNIVENEADRQVWSAFAPQQDGRVIETRWTLTR